MIERLLRHLTSADIHRNYVDTHGASIVGFAFTYLLGFRLLARLKNIGRIRLHQAHRTNLPDTNGATGDPVAVPRSSRRTANPNTLTWSPY